MQAIGLVCGEPTKLMVSVASPGRRQGELEVTVHVDMPWPAVEIRLERGTLQPEPVMSTGRVPDAPTDAGLLSCWTTVAENDALNTAVCRGAPVSVGGYPVAWAGVTAEGRFRLPTRWERSILCLQQAGRHARWYLPHPTAHGPVLERVACGSIDGFVTDLPAAAAGHTYVVLFGRGLLRLTARVAADGSFWLPAVPAGTFLLRAGDDDFARVREHLRAPLQLDDWTVLAKPEIGAVTVTVHADETTRGVQVPFDPSSR